PLPGGSPEEATVVAEEDARAVAGVHPQRVVVHVRGAGLVREREAGVHGVQELHAARPDLVRVRGRDLEQAEVPAEAAVRVTVRRSGIDARPRVAAVVAAVDAEADVAA